MPRAFIFAGKAAPGYRAAKEVIRLILQVARVLNEDPETSHILKVVFIPNYNVKLAEIIIPGADVSQHLSTSGTEASGTGNMKFAMNGSLLVATLDGASPARPSPRAPRAPWQRAAASFRRARGGREHCGNLRRGGR